MKNTIEFLSIVSVLIFAITQAIVYESLGISTIPSIISIIALCMILWVILWLLIEIKFKDEGDGK